MELTALRFSRIILVIYYRRYCSTVIFSIAINIRSRLPSGIQRKYATSFRPYFNLDRSLRHSRDLGSCATDFRQPERRSSCTGSGLSQRFSADGRHLRQRFRRRSLRFIFYSQACAGTRPFPAMVRFCSWNKRANRYALIRAIHAKFSAFISFYRFGKRMRSRFRGSPLLPQATNSPTRKRRNSLGQHGSPTRRQYPSHAHLGSLGRRSSAKSRLHGRTHRRPGCR